MTRDDIIRMARNVDGHMNDHRGGIDLSWDSLVRIVQTAIATEREACAKVCEQWGTEVRVETWNMAGQDCAAAIRARGRNDKG